MTGLLVTGTAALRSLRGTFFSIDLQLSNAQPTYLELGNLELSDDRSADSEASHRQGTHSGSPQRSCPHGHCPEAKGCDLTRLRSRLLC